VVGGKGERERERRGERQTDAIMTDRIIINKVIIIIKIIER
jgi:hypothetical protein